MNDIGLVSYFLIINIISNAGLTALLFYQYLKKKVNVQVFLLGFFMTAWCLSMFFFRLDWLGSGIYLARLVYATAAALVVHYFYSTFYLVEGPYSFKKYYYYFFNLTYLLIFSLTLFTPYIIYDVTYPAFGEPKIDFGPLYTSVYFVSIPTFITLGSLNLINVYRNSSGTQKLRVKFFLLGCFITSIITSITNLVLPTFGFYELNWLGQISSAVWLSLLSYSMIRYRLFGIRFIFGRFLYYFLLILVPYLTFYLVASFEIKYLHGLFSIESFLINIPISFLFIYVFNNFNELIKSFTERNVINTGYRPLELINSYRKKLSNILTIDEIYVITDKVFRGSLSMDKFHVRIYLNSEQSNGAITLGEYEGDFKKFEKPLIEKKLFKNSDYIFQEDFQYENFVKFSAIFKIKSDKFRCYIVVLDKNSSEGLNLEEVNLIHDLLEIFKVSLSRSILHREVKQFNQTLQDKVDEATAELEEQYEELQAIRAKERDMMDIIGHELRTPLSIIKISLGAIEMKLGKGARKIAEETLAGYLEQMKDAVDRETELLETMLTSTKLDSNKLEMNLDKVKVKKVVDDAVLGHQSQAEEKGLEVEAHFEDEGIEVFADRVRFNEVVDNLVSNAVKYTIEGRVDITVEEAEDEMVKIEVKDTGPGIPKKAQKRLGEKFYRVKQYVKDKDGNEVEVVRPGGTGLGLYVTFGLAEAMGGRIDIKSEVGVGSVFTVFMPKYIGQNPKASEKKNKNAFARLGLSKEDVNEMPDEPLKLSELGSKKSKKYDK